MMCRSGSRSGWWDFRPGLRCAANSRETYYSNACHRRDSTVRPPLQAAPAASGGLKTPRPLVVTRNVLKDACNLLSVDRHGTNRYTELARIGGQPLSEVGVPKHRLDACS